MPVCNRIHGAVQVARCIDSKYVLLGRHIYVYNHMSGADVYVSIRCIGSV